MANTLTNVTPQLLAQGLLALREFSIMPRLVNGDYDQMAAEKGETIDVPIPSAIAAAAVSPSNTAPATADVSPTKVQISLDQWYEAPFYLTDKDMMTAMDGTIPMQASEAIKSLANNVDNYILALYTGVYGYTGVAGTTPFASTTKDATDARKTLTNQLAPLQDRRFVFDADAEANALGLRAFQDMSFGVSAQDIAEGNLPNKLGFNWFIDQNIPTHTAGTAANGTTDTAGYAAGVNTLTMASAGTGTFVVGDIFTIAGDTQTYVTTVADADISGGATLTFEPALQVTIAASATAITFKATHVANLAFHRDAFAFATRPLEAAAEGLGNLIQTATDPVSGLSLRLEISREHKRTRFSYDILYGAKLVRAALATRAAG